MSVVKVTKKRIYSPKIRQLDIPMKIAYLASQITIPSSPHRRGDAFEHDFMMESLRKAESAEVTDISWDDDIDFSQFDAAIIGTCWDYQDRFAEFLKKLTLIDRQTLLLNPLALIGWNADKSYLKDLEDSGTPIIPTLFIDNPGPADLDKAFQHFQCEKLVVKRQVGASAEGQSLIHQNDLFPHFNRPMMLQPFMPAISSEGEISFIFIGGTFSHAVLKRPADGDYRIQSSYGGQESMINPPASDIEAARNTLSRFETPPLYARVDMLRGEDGILLIMELELIEPYLYPEQCPELGGKIMGAIRKMLS